MKKLLVLLMSTIITLSSAFISFAGEWKQDNVGWWYQKDDGSYVKDDWLTLNDTAKYHFDSNGYMQTGLAEINGVRHYFYEDGRLTHNWDTPEGYKVDSDGKIVDENTPGIIFKVIWGTLEDEGPNDVVFCRFINEGKVAFTVDPIIEINTDGKVNNYKMVDKNTYTYCKYGIVPPNNQDVDFVYVFDRLQQFTFNKNSTLNFTVTCDSFSKEYYRIIPSFKIYRFNIVE